MNTSFKIVAILISLSTFSCTDSLLDARFDGSIESEDIWSAAVYAEGVLVSAYSSIPGEYMYFDDDFLDSATDDAVTNQYTSTIYNLGLGGWSPDLDPVGEWSEWSEQIRIVNLWLENGQTTTYYITDELYNTQILNRLQGEAYFLRAWYHWLMLQSYAGLVDGVAMGVPIYTSVDMQDNGVVQRSTYEECVVAIIADCDLAASLLPDQYVDTEGAYSTQNLGRANRLGALALKSRVALYAASPAFNLAGDIALWERAASYSLAAIEAIGGTLSTLDNGIFSDINDSEVLYAREGDTSNSLEKANRIPSNIDATSVTTTVSGTEYTLATIPADGSQIEGDVWIITDTESQPAASEYVNLLSALNSAGRPIDLIFESILKIQSGTLKGAENLTTVTASLATDLQGNALQGCVDLESVSLPMAVSLRAGCMANCPKLTSLTFGTDRVEEGTLNMKYNAFVASNTDYETLGETDLSKVDLTIGYVSGSYVDLSSDNSGTTYYINGGVEVTADSGYLWIIATDADDDSGYGIFKSITQEAEIDNSVIGADGIDLSTIPSDASKIEGDTWVINDADATNISNLTTSLSSAADSGREISLEFPNYTASITSSLFNGLAAIVSVSFPEFTGTINQSAFGSCANLQAASFPKANKMGKWAFQYCPSLTSLTFATESTVDSGQNYQAFTTNNAPAGDGDTDVSQITLTIGSDNGSSAEYMTDALVGADTYVSGWIWVVTLNDETYGIGFGPFKAINEI
ncbi:MAG: RagB/SusD family nutrient uptake outer membrane protein [Rikenellaceae bacterium]